jgi:hypothetical protein
MLATLENDFFDQAPQQRLTVLEALLFDFLNYTSGQLDPSYAAIARKANVCVRTVIPARLSADSRLFPNQLAVDSVPSGNDTGAVTWGSRLRSRAWSIRRRSFASSR